MIGMLSPEILIKDLNVALRELRGAARLLGDERIDAELLPAIRRLLLSEVLGNTSILAIGGSQGSGKTTLLRTLYGLDTDAEQWLRPNEGRGEKLPILVVEQQGLAKAQGAIRRLRDVDGRYLLVEDVVGVEVFQKAVGDPDPEVLLPVLRVPKRYFERADQAWLLLPGYEKIDRSNKAWQELMRQALVAASGCIVVTDETRLANQQQVEIVKDMLSNELQGAQTLVVVSKTESLRGKLDRLQELSSTAQEVFRRAQDDPRHKVVCVGSDDKEYIAEWLPALASAIQELASSGCGNRKAQLARLEEVLGRDLTRALNQVNNKAQLFFQKPEDGENGPREVLQSSLQAFDDARDELREKYLVAIMQILGEQFDPAWDRLQESLKHDHEGFWKSVKNFFGSATEVQQKIESDVNLAWRGSVSVLERHATAIAGLTKKELVAPDEAMRTHDALSYKTESPLQRLGYVDSRKQLINWQRPNAEDHKNLQLLFAGRQAVVQDGVVQRPSKDFERAVKLVPALTLEYARIASLMPALVGVQADSLTEASRVHQADLVNQAVRQLSDGVDLGKTVLRSIATILAVDVASDGDVDVIPALLNATGLGLGSAAAKGGTAVAEGAATSTGAGAGAAAVGGVGAAVIGVVAVGYLVYSAMREVRSHDEKARVVAYQMLLNIKDHHYRHFMTHFDSLMNLVRSRLRQALRERYRLDETLMEQDRLAKAIADARALQRDLLDELGRSGQTVLLFNVGDTA